MITSKLIVTLVVVVGSIFASNGFWDWLKTKRKKMTPYEEVTIALGRERLNVLCKRYIKFGYIPEDYYESFKALGDAYIDAGGNTKVKALFEDAMKLPRKWDLENEQ